MHYVYMLQSLSDPEKHYVGCTADLRKRVVVHNRGQVFHTAKYRPWVLKTYMAFSDKAKAYAFEAYLKTASGRAFARKRF